MMKLLIALVSAAVMVIPSVASANLLGDAGFEGAGTGPWSYYESHANFLENFDNTSVVHSGSQALEIKWTSSMPEWQLSEAKQVLSVTPGQQFDGSVYAKITNAIENGSAYLETIFKDSSGGETGKFTSSTLSAVTDWTLLSVSGIVPTSSVTVDYRLLAFVTAGGSANGEVYFDDGVAAIPEPTSMLLLGSGLIGLLGFGRKKLTK